MSSFFFYAPLLFAAILSPSAHAQMIHPTPAVRAEAPVPPLPPLALWEQTEQAWLLPFFPSAVADFNPPDFDEFKKAYESWLQNPLVGQAFDQNEEMKLQAAELRSLLTSPQAHQKDKAIWASYAELVEHFQKSQRVKPELLTGVKECSRAIQNGSATEMKKTYVNFIRHFQEEAKSFPELHQAITPKLILLSDRLQQKHPKWREVSRRYREFIYEYSQVIPKLGREPANGLPMPDPQLVQGPIAGILGGGKVPCPAGGAPAPADPVQLAAHANPIEHAADPAAPADPALPGAHAKPAAPLVPADPAAPDPKSPKPAPPSRAYRYVFDQPFIERLEKRIREKNQGSHKPQDFPPAMHRFLTNVVFKWPEDKGESPALGLEGYTEACHLDGKDPGDFAFLHKLNQEFPQEIREFQDQSQKTTAGAGPLYSPHNQSPLSPSAESYTRFADTELEQYLDTTYKKVPPSPKQVDFLRAIYAYCLTKYAQIEIGQAPPKEPQQKTWFDPEKVPSGNPLCSAGGILYTTLSGPTSRQNETYILLGKERGGSEPDTYCFMQGKVEKPPKARQAQSYLAAAAAEIHQETAGVFKISEQNLKAYPYIHLKKKGEPGPPFDIPLTYLVPVPYESTFTFDNELKNPVLPDDYKEMTKYDWFKLSDIRKAIEDPNMKRILVPQGMDSQGNPRPDEETIELNVTNSKNRSIKVKLKTVAYKALKHAIEKGLLKDKM